MCDVAIVGGGIVGLAFAREAARRGQSVILVERSCRPEGASVRNFGMIWPIGQRPGTDYDRAMRSQEIWKEVAAESGIWLNECGSLHVAYHDDESAVIEEFITESRFNGVSCSRLTADEITSRFPSIRPESLQSALFSPTELAVNPREAISQLAAWLERTGQATIRWNTTVTHVDSNVVTTATGESIRTRLILVCSGSDFETLLPSHFAASGIRRCKLQMLRTDPQPNRFTLGTHVAAGLTLTHYAAFEACPSLPSLKARYQRECPELIRFGIHVMASQQNTGEVTIGDSHEYDDAISLFHRDEIDEMILGYLDHFLRLPDRRIAARWSGIYAKHPRKLFVTDEVRPGVVIAVAPGGAGMTLSFALAEEWWKSRS